MCTAVVTCILVLCKISFFITIRQRRPFIGVYVFIFYINHTEFTCNKMYNVNKSAIASPHYSVDACVAATINQRRGVLQ